MKKTQNRKFRRGQGMTEYIIIVALIAIAAIGVVTLFGNNIRNLFATSADGLAGQIRETSGAQDAKSRNLENRNISDFGKDHQMGGN